MIEHISPVMGRNGDSHKVRKVVIVFILLLALVAFSLFLLRHFGREATPDPSSEPASGAGVTVGTIEQEKVNVGEQDIQTLLNEQVAEGMFRIFISTHITVDSEGNMEPLIQNAGRNKYYCWVEILDEYGTTIYQTDVIPPGYKVEEDKMVPLGSKGVNRCEAVFHLLEGTTKDSEEVNSIGVAVDVVQE